MTRFSVALLYLISLMILGSLFAVVSRKERIQEINYWTRCADITGSGSMYLFVTATHFANAFRVRDRIILEAIKESQFSC